MDVGTMIEIVLAVIAIYVVFVAVLAPGEKRH